MSPPRTRSIRPDLGEIMREIDAAGSDLPVWRDSLLITVEVSS